MGTLRQLRKLVGVLLLILSLVVLLIVWIKSGQPDRSDSIDNPPDQCYPCHNDIRDMSEAHPNAIFGCAACHLGNPDANDKKTAHAGMVRNPSDLKWTEKTCGQNDCHPDINHAVRNSIMTTNSGLVAATLFQWGESDTRSDTLIEITENIIDSSLARSHIRKLCAGCHVNKQRGDLPGEFGQRGGGCNDCHLINEAEGKHPQLSIQMKIDVCEKCHNRSNRTALNYQGKFESEGYGTPYEQGNFSADTLSGFRFYYHLPGDVHFEAGMVCIDCHVAEGLMGDGKRHAHLEDQVKISCMDCHKAQFAKPSSENWLWKIISVNPNLDLPPDSQFAVSAGGAFIPNVIRKNQTVVLNLKTEKRRLDVKQIFDKSECNSPGHERLSCQACHTAWTPQCYGCHDLYDPEKRQLDKISYRETKGHWTEGRSYLRFEEPALGLDQFGRIMPFAPGCQVFLSIKKSDTTLTNSKIWLTMAAFDPHTTRLKVPECHECHSNPKRIGLGSGGLDLTPDHLQTNSIYDPALSGIGDVPLESLTSFDGNALQVMSRARERPFSRNEILKIYRASLCIVCHETYDDPIYANFNESIKNYLTNKQLPCYQ